MTSNHWAEKAERHLRRLCLDIAHRRTGSAGNHTATEMFAATVASFGFETARPEFDCMDWTHGDARLAIGGKPFAAYVGPYSLGCAVSAPLAVVSTVSQLEAVDACGKILLVRGDLAREQLMPKNFPFYNPDHHREIIHLLERAQPAAIVAATSRNPELAGGVYPFPLIEDGDFDIPSAYITEEEGERLAEHAGKVAALELEAHRIPAKGFNVYARKGTDVERRVVVFAHIDAKEDTPGALDNGTGIVVLLLLAELLADYGGDLTVEMVALNGEDYYAASGEIEYVQRNMGRWGEIVLGINIDVAGYRVGDTAYSLYACPEAIDACIRDVFASRQNMVEGEPWYQSDHSLFIQNQTPALAITSERFMELSTYVTHTAKDVPDLVDYDKVAAVALALRDLVLDLNRMLS